MADFLQAYLAQNEEDSYKWRQAYITTFLEKDIPNLGFSIPPPANSPLLADVSPLPWTNI